MTVTITLKSVSFLNLILRNNCKCILLSFPSPDTEDASETDLAKHDEDDYVEIKEQ